MTDAIVFLLVMIALILCLGFWRMGVWLERIARACGWPVKPLVKPPVGLMDGLTDEQWRRGRGTGWKP